MYRRVTGMKTHQLMTTRCTNKDPIASTNVAVSGILAFRLADLPDASDFVDLFQYYRINYVTVDFIPGGVMSVTQQPGTGTMTFAPIMYHAIDVSGAITAPTRTDIQSFTSCRSNTAAHRFKRGLRPRPAAPLYNTAVTTAYGLPTSSKQWISSSFPAVPHYGLIYYMESTTLGAPFFAYTPQCKFYIQFMLPY